MCQTEHCYVAIEELMPNNRFCSKNWTWTKIGLIRNRGSFLGGEVSSITEATEKKSLSSISGNINRTHLQSHYITEKALASRANTDSTESEISQSSWEIVLEICKCVLEI